MQGNVNLYWVGSRESDIFHTGGLFYGSVTLYGTGEYSLSEKEGIRVDNNTKSTERDRFILTSISEIAKKDPNARFLFYDSSWIYEIEGLSQYRDKFICYNAEQIYRRYNDKIGFYQRMKGIVPLLHKGVIKGNDCTYETLHNLTESSEIIIQAPISNGGNGTFYLNRRNEKRISKKLDADMGYLYSRRYINNVPVNVHFVISGHKAVMLPPSVQILREEDDRLRYRGADYAAYPQIANVLRKRFETYARRVAEEMQRDGYRGICGIDGIIAGEDVYIVEFNGRFQGSSALLNLAFSELNLPSVQQLQIMAFEDILPNFPEVSIPYSTYSYYGGKNERFSRYIFKNAPHEPFVKEIHADGYRKKIRDREGRYLFRLVFRGNITSVNTDGGVFVQENVVEPDSLLSRKVRACDRLAVKIMLMTMGVKFNKASFNFLQKNGGIRPGNNNAVDVNILNMVVNAPCDIKYIVFTPFIIVLRNSKFFLQYYNRILAEVSVYPIDKFGSKRTSSGVPYADIAYLSTDRLRIHMTNECIFKREGRGCTFCNIVPGKEPIQLSDIEEVVADYVQNVPAVHHFLVGGQSMDQRSGMERIEEIIRIIRKYTKDKHIYVMALPYDLKAIKKLVDAGMDELACNIEVFHPELARRYMPGKGGIKRETYFEVLSYAHTLLPEPGAVRAMLIYGLEPEKSFADGVRKLTKCGIQPIISIFRPLPGTPLENLIAPPLRNIYEIYNKIERLCVKQGFHLGPACVYCQNNTLSLPNANIPLRHLN